MSTKKIVGLTGGPGSGKQEVVNFLVKHNFRHFSAREDILWPEVDRCKLPRDRTSLNTVSNELRGIYGPEYVAHQLFRLACRTEGDAVIESIYTVGEITTIRHDAENRGVRFILISVDAPLHVRYKRIQGRQSETDKVSFEQFSVQEQREQKSPDPSKHNLFACRKLADLKVVNAFLDVQSLHNHLERLCRIHSIIR
jgi:dephospho-CoA kinase